MTTIKHADGLYFGLPEADYHRDPALSASDCKRLLASPLEYWMRSHMNPDRQEDDEPWLSLGKAYHKRLLEGASAFAAAYCCELDAADYPDALRGAEALRDHAARLGIAKPGRSIADLCASIRSVDFAVQLWPEIEAAWCASVGGRLALKPRDWKQIERAAAIVEAHPHLCKAFAGGHAEVSVFWTDAETGLRMKSRFDYLKIGATVDLKTFSSKGLPIEVEMARAVASYRYNVQAAFYGRSGEAARAYAKSGTLFVHGERPSSKWLADFAAMDAYSFVFVFQQTGDVPDVRGREMTRDSLIYKVGSLGVRRAIETYLDCLAKYGEAPWIDDSPVVPFRDEDFPAYALEV